MESCSAKSKACYSHCGLKPRTVNQPATASLAYSRLHQEWRLFNCKTRLFNEAAPTHAISIHPCNLKQFKIRFYVTSHLPCCGTVMLAYHRHSQFTLNSHDRLQSQNIVDVGVTPPLRAVHRALLVQHSTPTPPTERCRLHKTVALSQNCCRGSITPHRQLAVRHCRPWPHPRYLQALLRPAWRLTVTCMVQQLKTGLAAQLDVAAPAALGCA